MVTSMLTQKSALFTISLRNRITEERISARFYNPTMKRTYLADVKKWERQWNCELRLSSSRTSVTKMLASDSWLGSLMLAIECLRQRIEIGEERQWVDRNGVESWVILPRSVPFTWGYPLYRSISELVESEEARYSNELQNRRMKKAKIR